MKQIIIILLAITLVHSLTFSEIMSQEYIWDQICDEFSTEVVED